MNLSRDNVQEYVRCLLGERPFKMPLWSNPPGLSVVLKTAVGDAGTLFRKISLEGSETDILRARLVLHIDSLNGQHIPYCREAEEVTKVFKKYFSKLPLEDLLTLAADITIFRTRLFEIDAWLLSEEGSRDRWLSLTLEAYAERKLDYVFLTEDSEQDLLREELVHNYLYDKRMMDLTRTASAIQATSGERDVKERAISDFQNRLLPWVEVSSFDSSLLEDPVMKALLEEADND